MIRIGHYTLFLCICLLTVGCNRSKSGLKNDLEKFMQSKIAIPELVDEFKEIRDTALIWRDEPLVRMVIFYDSTVCGSCKMSQIWQWQMVTDYAKNTQGRFRPLFIFAPSAGKEQEVRVALRTIPPDYPIFVDSEQEFISANPNIPTNKIMHVFLLDKNNRVVLVGDPLNNNQLWGLYMTTIKELIDNGGVTKQ